MENLIKLQKGKEELIKYYNEKFEIEKGIKIRTENENVLKSAEYIENKERVKKENKKIEKWNNVMNIVSILIPSSILVLFLYVNLKGSEVSGSLFINILILFTPLIYLFLNDFLMKSYKDIEEVSLTQELKIKEEKEIYLNKLVCSMSELNNYYGILNECLGREELNKKMTKMVKNDEDVGSYSFILRLFDEAIESKKEEEKSIELKEKLDRVLKCSHENKDEKELFLHEVKN